MPIEESVYKMIGEEGFRRLTRAFYQQVPGDDVLGPRTILPAPKSAWVIS